MNDIKQSYLQHVTERRMYYNSNLDARRIFLQDGGGVVWIIPVAAAWRLST